MPAQPQPQLSVSPREQILATSLLSLAGITGTPGRTPAAAWNPGGPRLAAAPAAPWVPDGVERAMGGSDGLSSRSRSSVFRIPPRDRDIRVNLQKMAGGCFSSRTRQEVLFTEGVARRCGGGKGEEGHSRAHPAALLQAKKRTGGRGRERESACSDDQRPGEGRGGVVLSWPAMSGRGQRTRGPGPLRSARLPLFPRSG